MVVEHCIAGRTFNRWILSQMLRRKGLRPQSVSPRADFWNDRLKSSILEIPARLKKALGR